jgi:hypothetical protein
VSHDATLRVLGDWCLVHGDHRPRPTRTVKHHVWPQQYGGPTIDSNLVLICDTGHYNVHAALDAMLAGRLPPKVARAELRLAQAGYDAILAAYAGHVPKILP